MMEGRGPTPRPTLRAVLVLAALGVSSCSTGFLSEGRPKDDGDGPLLADRDDGVARQRLAHYQSILASGRFSYTVGDNPAIHRDLGALTGLVDSGEELPVLKAPGDDGPVPVAWDAREFGIGLPPTRDQGDCGSCWAFSTIGALEVAVAVFDSVHVDLSEQELLDCNPYGYSCGGGFFAHDMLVSQGAAWESDYPYRASRGACSSSVAMPYRGINYGRVRGDVESIKAAIYRYGSVSVSMTVCGSIPGYTGGIYDSTECNHGLQNHAVLLVGWDDEATHGLGRGVWIMRNSWGSGWGEGGYMRIAWGAARIAEEGTFVEYTEGSPSPEPEPAPEPSPEPGPEPSPEPGPDPEPWPDPEPSPDGWICLDTCPWAGDGYCEDCGPDAGWCGCEYGTDCWDCGPREGGSPFPEPDAGICDDSCYWAGDGECDDCGPGATWCVCPYGSDCWDCGPRY